MPLRIWNDIADVESVTTVDGNIKIATGANKVGELDLWEDVYGSVLDIAHWIENISDLSYAEADSHSVNKINNKLKISVTEAGGSWAGWGVKSILTFPGDFNREIELDITDDGQQYVVFRFYNASNNNFFIAKRKYGATNQIAGYTTVNGVTTSTTFNTANVSPKFKLIRSGTNLECWYDVGGGWIKLHQYTGVTSIGTLTLYIYIVTRNGNTVTCDFNNYLANSGLPVWDDSPELIGDPVVETGVDIICDMSTFTVSSTGSGNVKHQYMSSGAWSGTWLTEAEMQALGTINASQFKHQFNSDGYQDITLTSIECSYKATYYIKATEIKEALESRLTNVTVNMEPDNIIAEESPQVAIYLLDREPQYYPLSARQTKDWTLSFELWCYECNPDKLKAFEHRDDLMGLVENALLDFINDTNSVGGRLRMEGGSFENGETETGMYMAGGSIITEYDWEADTS